MLLSRRDTSTVIARLVQEGKCKIAHGTVANRITKKTKHPKQQRQRQGAAHEKMMSDLGSSTMREHIIAKAAGERGAPLHDIVSRIRRWVNRRVGAGEKGTITAPMAAAMQKGVAKPRRSYQDVRAGLVALAAEGNLRVEWKVKGDGNTEKDAMKEAYETLTKWMTVPEAREVVRKASTRVHQTTEEKVIFDFGEGWGGAKEGFQRCAKVYGIDMVMQYKGAREGHTTPDMLIDWGKVKGNPIHHTRELAKVSKKQLVAAHFSPECDPETILNNMEVANGRGRGPHAKKAREPQQRRSVAQMVKALKEYEKEVPGFTWFVEQPRGSALGREDCAVMKPLGRPRSVSQCCYGYRHEKPTWIWTNAGEHWQPRSNKRGACIHCEACNTGSEHEEWIMRRGKEERRKRAGTKDMQGFTFDAVKNRIHPNLAEEMATAAIARWEAME